VVLQLVQQHMEQLPPRALANCLWAATKLATTLSSSASQHWDAHSLLVHGSSSAKAVAPRHGAASSCLKLALRLLARVPAAARGFEPQHVANTFYAMAMLHTLATSVSMTASATAAVQPQPAPSASSSLFPNSLMRFCELHDIPPVDGHAVVAALQRHAGPQLLAGMAPQGLANTLYSLAVLDLQPDEGGRASRVRPLTYVLPLPRACTLTALRSANAGFDLLNLPAYFTLLQAGCATCWTLLSYAYLHLSPSISPPPCGH
jgi:hypothetical protein